jgi:hypothetical protein
MTSEGGERHFTLDLHSGEITEIVDPDARVPVAMAGADDEDDWREIGEIDPTTGRARVDYSLARRWRPLSELWRWR